MTREEFYAKYGEVEVSFDYYYKYSFNYSGRMEDGNIVYVSMGGDPDNIYRESVSSNEIVSVSALGPYSGTVYKNGKEIESFYDY